MRLSEVQALKVPACVEVGGGAFGIEIYPTKLNRKDLKAQVERAKEIAEKAEQGGEPTEEETGSIASLLVELLASWELTDDDGKALPITIKSLLDELGFYICNRIWAAVQEALSPNVSSGDDA